MATVDPIFTSLLGTTLDDVKAPQNLPDGTYYGTVKDYILGKSTGTNNPFVQVNVNNITPGPDIVLPDGMNLSKKGLNFTFYLQDKNGDQNLFPIKSFFESLGLQTQGKGVGELLPQLAGSAVMLSVNKRNSQDGKREFENVQEIKGRQ